MNGYDIVNETLTEISVELLKRAGKRAARRHGYATFHNMKKLAKKSGDQYNKFTNYGMKKASKLKKT